MACPSILPKTEDANGHIRFNPTKTCARLANQETIAGETETIGTRVPERTGQPEETSQTRSVLTSSLNVHMLKLIYLLSIYLDCFGLTANALFASSSLTDTTGTNKAD